jgi:Transglutaminase-like superfamily
MASYWLAPDAYICIGSHYCVFLDARSDRYLAIDRPTMDRLSPWLSGWPDEIRPPYPGGDPPADLTDLVTSLLLRGLLTGSEPLGKAVRQQLIRRPSDCILPVTQLAPPRSTLRYVPAIVRSLIWARRQLSRYPLAATLAAVVARRKSNAQRSSLVDPPGATALVAAFLQCHALYSRPNACLFESLSLIHFLSMFDYFPSWVFGVIPEPFQAHCWLQQHSLVLNDSIEHVVQFTPIMQV